MRQTIKAGLPKPIIIALRKILNQLRRRDRPLIKKHFVTSDSVLQCCIAYNSYGGYCVPLSSSHRPAVQKIFSGKVYEPDTIKYMIEHSNDGDIIHAGTFFGDFIPALSGACTKDAKLWAFEPNPENYQCASITIQLNSLTNVEIRNIGLGASEDSLPLKISDESGISLGGSSKITNIKDSGSKGHIEVNIRRIDDVIPEERKIDILQLDIESFEKSALNGGIKTIKRCKPILILESVPSDKWMNKNIFPLGYRQVEKVHANTVFIAE